MSTGALLLQAIFPLDCEESLFFGENQRTVKRGARDERAAKPRSRHCRLPFVDFAAKERLLVLLAVYIPFGAIQLRAAHVL